MKDLIPDNVAEYRTKEYWDWRYEQESKEGVHYEWFKDYSYFKPVLKPFLKPEDTILMLGCGNSKISEDLYAEGHEHITNLDYSEPIIEMMRSRTAQSCPKMTWIVADFRNMPQIPSSSHSLVLDKGSLDALWSDGGSQWSPSPTVLQDIHQSCDEIARILQPDGLFISITFGQPHFRLPHMERPYWRLISQHQLGLYYIYVFQRNHSE